MKMQSSPTQRTPFRSIITALAAAGLLFGASAQAQTDYTWTGIAWYSGIPHWNPDWNNAENWEPAGGPPSATDNVIMVEHEPMINSTSFTFNNLTFDGGSTFRQIGTSTGPISFNVNGNMTHTGTGSSLRFRGSTAEGSTTQTLAVNIAGNLSTSGGQAIEFGRHRDDTRYNYALAGLSVGGTTTIGNGGQIRIYTNGATATFGEVAFATTGSNMRLLLSEGSFTTPFGEKFPSGRTVEIAGLSGGIDSAASRVAVSSSSAVDGGAVTLRLTGSGTYNYSGQIVNRADDTVGVSSISLEKTGTGLQILSGTGVWGGTTTVASGGLIIDGTHTARGNGYTIQSGARFGGDGLITLAGDELGDATMLFETGSHFVFDPNRTLTVNDSALNTWTVDMNNMTPESLLDIDGNSIVWSSIAPGIYDLIDGTATFTNINENWITNIDGSGRDVRFVAGSLQLEVVPEPSTYAAILGLLALGFVWFRRRKG